MWNKTTTCKIVVGNLMIKRERYGREESLWAENHSCGTFTRRKLTLDKVNVERSGIGCVDEVHLNTLYQV